MPVSSITQNKHLLWRAAFGPMAENISMMSTMSTDSLWKLLVSSSAGKPEKIIVADVMAERGYNNEMSGNKTEQEKAQMKREQRRQSRQQISELNLRWLDEMVNSKAQLREKLSFFWHGHFACKTLSSYFAQDLLHKIRSNALGNFGTLLTEVSKSPAMLQYLNNQQNRKGHPNENFAREVMELFTMGRGNYSENDVKEAARSFTGWGFNAEGNFIFRAGQHDTGEKTFLGRTGNFSGDDIINILLEQPATAIHITNKMYRFFVSEKPDQARIKMLAAAFLKSGYDISSLVKDIFTSSWFFEEKNIGAKIKSPVELIVGIRRYMPLTFDNDAAQLLFQKVLGQILFYPPNVAGWPGGTSWIDSSTLMVRMQVPQVFAAKENITIQPKNDDDVNMGMATEKAQTVGAKLKQQNGSVIINWPPVLANFDKVTRPNLLGTINEQLWQTSNRVSEASMNNYIDAATRESYIKSVIIALMSTPEYQMC